MKGTVPTIDEIKIKIAPLALKYGVESIYVFGSYARGEATDSSDIDILVFGSSGFKKSLIYALSEELRAIMNKDIDIFEISEINVDSDFYSKVMDEKVLVA